MAAEKSAVDGQKSGKNSSKGKQKN